MSPRSTAPTVYTPIPPISSLAASALSPSTSSAPSPHASPASTSPDLAPHQPSVPGLGLQLAARPSPVLNPLPCRNGGSAQAAQARQRRWRQGLPYSR